jgi:hypothetical protein
MRLMIRSLTLSGGPFTELSQKFDKSGTEVLIGN